MTKDLSDSLAVWDAFLQEWPIERLHSGSRLLCGGSLAIWKMLCATRDMGDGRGRVRNDEYEYGDRFDRFAERTSLSDREPQRLGCLRDRPVYNRTYSYSNGRPLMPVFGLPSQFAILPGSVTGCMSERT